MNQPFARPISTLRRSLRNKSTRQLLFDVTAIFGAAIVIRIITFPLDLFEHFAEYSRAHEEWQLDEWMITTAIMSVALIVFSVRRIRSQRRELRLRRAAEQHASMLALQDALTGLPNRRRFLDALNMLPSGGEHAVFILDLDGFKQVNDAYGHASGDEVLRVVAQRLKTLGDNRVLAARLGGDEFAMLVRDLRSEHEAEGIAQSVISAVEIPIQAGGVEHRLGISIGITMLDQEKGRYEESMRRADVALYRAKEDPGSAYCFYDASLDTALTERIRLEKELRGALAANEIVPHYQPIVDLKSGDIVKFEALARWQHAELGEIPPARFVELAEERGLIADLTDRIAKRACLDALRWPTEVTLSINLAPTLLKNEAFPLRLAKILADTGLPAHRLEVEITERALDSDVASVRKFLENLRIAGIGVALDDFGTGYSSLSRLRELPFDEIKIDRSFVQSLSHTDDGAVIIRAIIELGRGLGMKLTAEGVEETSQREALIAEGCQQAQGFLFSKAIPADEAAAMFDGARTRAIA